MGCVYLITSPSGSQYVGLTKHSAQQRWKGHINSSVSGSQYPLHRAIRKYGAESFRVETLHRSSDHDELCQRERREIEERSPTYNQTLGGDGVIPTPETRQKMSAGVRRHWETRDRNFNTPDRRAAVSRAVRGKPKSAEHRQKLSESCSGWKHTEETRAKMRAAWARRKQE